MRQVKLEAGLEELQTLSAERRFKLEATKAFHEYMREANDVEDWINDQMQTACSEDYGQDYEHLQVARRIIVALGHCTLFECINHCGLSLLRVH